MWRMEWWGQKHKEGTGGVYPKEGGPGAGGGAVMVTWGATTLIKDLETKCLLAAALQPDALLLSVLCPLQRPYRGHFPSEGARRSLPAATPITASSAPHTRLGTCGS